MKQFINPNDYKSILVLDGAIPTKKFFDEMQLPIISADGATNKLHRMGVTPHIVIGDLDSVDPEILANYKHERIEDQSSSDFQKALKYMKDNDWFPTIICGITGGYIDHEMNNINIFMQTDGNIFITDGVIGYKVQEESEYKFPLGTKISIIGIPECVVSTRGLRWELEKYTTKFPGQNSCFNRVVSEELIVIPNDGAALMLIYTKEINDTGLGACHQLLEQPHRAQKKG